MVDEVLVISRISLNDCALVVDGIGVGQGPMLGCSERQVAMLLQSSRGNRCAPEYVNNVLPGAVGSPRWEFGPHTGSTNW